MVVTADYTWPDGSNVEFSISDGCDSYNPTRLAEMRREVLSMLSEIRAEHPVTPGQAD